MHYRRGRTPMEDPKTALAEALEMIENAKDCQIDIIIALMEKLLEDQIFQYNNRSNSDVFDAILR